MAKTIRVSIELIQDILSERGARYVELRNPVPKDARIVWVDFDERTNQAVLVFDREVPEPYWAAIEPQKVAKEA